MGILQIQRTIILSFLFFAATAPAQSGAEQLIFSAEDETVTNFAELPPAAMKLLTADRDDFPDAPPANFRCTQREDTAPSYPGPTILCRTLPRSTKGGQDYLVIGVGDLRGAHIVPFWIFHCDGSTAKLLFKTRSDQIAILSRRFNGYPEIASTWIFGAGSTIRTTRFRFKGNRYVQFASREDHN